SLPPKREPAPVPVDPDRVLVEEALPGSPALAEAAVLAPFGAVRPGPRGRGGRVPGRDPLPRRRASDHVRHGVLDPGAAPPVPALPGPGHPGAPAPGRAVDAEERR